MINVAVIYYSATGNVHALADAVATGAQQEGAHVRVRRVAELAPDWAAGELADKAVTGFTSAINTHGGSESTLLALYNTMHHWGAITVPPGYTDEAVTAAGGNPYGTAHPSAGGPPGDTALAAARYQGRRLARIGALLAAGAPAEPAVAR